jgi:hypothetical protein
MLELGWYLLDNIATHHFCAVGGYIVEEFAKFQKFRAVVIGSWLAGHDEIIWQANCWCN